VFGDMSRFKEMVDSRSIVNIPVKEWQSEKTNCAINPVSLMLFAD
jgi:hypothetical protein